MRSWLIKSEPDEFSIDDLLAAPERTVGWFGVRNYQARNFMRDQMRLGDGILFYHSSCARPGIVGLATVASGAYPDPTQFDPANKYFDAKATPENPRWMQVDVRGEKKISLIGLPQLRAHADLSDMPLLKRGNRLSITPVSMHEWRVIIQQLLIDL
jgi:predicted RNA-binding protein with PUA-like domain